MGEGRWREVLVRNRREKGLTGSKVSETVTATKQLGQGNEKEE